MKKRGLKILLFTALLLVIAGSGVLYIRQQNRQQAIETSLNWARMSPLPESAENIDVLVEGSMFTREFEIEFQASEADIKAWLADSPGTAFSFSPLDSPTEGTVVYKISEPNALFAEVQIDWVSLTVVIHTYWS